MSEKKGLITSRVTFWGKEIETRVRRKKTKLPKIPAESEGFLYHLSLQTLSTFPAWTVVELHGTVVSHTVVT